MILFRGLLCAVMVAMAGTASAELYVAGQLGAHLPNDVSNTEWKVGAANANGSDIALQNSFMYGAKVGYYFDQLPWLGVETEFYNATPHVEQQRIRIGTTPFALTGTHHRVFTWSPFTVVVRYQAGELEPYAGLGLGVFFSHLSTTGLSSSDTGVGLHTQVGLRYRVTPHVAVFGEWKYDQANLVHAIGSGLTFDGDYSAHILAFGVGYHF